MKVVIATDGSPCALAAVAYAAALFGDRDPASRTLTLLNVHDDVAFRHAERFVGRATVSDYLRELSEADLAPARALLADRGLSFTAEIRQGHVAEQIVAFANAGRFDLIVLGAKGRSAIADFLLGSVAQRVLSSASQSVLLVR